MIRTTTKVERHYLRLLGVRFPWLIRYDPGRLYAMRVHTADQHGHHETGEEVQARALARIVSQSQWRFPAPNWQLWLAVAIILLVFFATRAHGQAIGPAGGMIGPASQITTITLKNGNGTVAAQFSYPFILKLDSGTWSVSGQTATLPAGAGSPALRRIVSGAVDGANTEFTLPGTPNTDQLQVFWNGVLMQSPDDFTIAGAVITTYRPPKSGDVLQVFY